MKSRHLILASVVLVVVSMACHHNDRHLAEAKALYEAGVKQRASKRTVAAAESFSNALIQLNYCNQNQEDILLLKAMVTDNLGVMYWKNGLNEEALSLFNEAIEIARSYSDSALLMTALRDAGRVSSTLQRIDQAGFFYNEALAVGKQLGDLSFLNETYLEMSHDLYLEGGDFDQAIQTAETALAEGADSCFCNLVIGLSQYYLDENDSALAYLHQAAQSEKASIRMSAFQCLYFIFLSTGDFESALAFHEQYAENRELSDQQYRTQEVQRVKSEYDLQMQQYQLRSEQRMRETIFVGILAIFVVALVFILVMLRQKTLKERLEKVEMKNQLETALKKNKVYLTALALSEQITVSSLDFNIQEQEWDDYVELIDMVYDGFTQKLLEQYPTLNKNDLQICSLTRQGFSNQVISILMNIQTGSYSRRKSRIKQEKMNGLYDERSFEEIINEI